MTTAPTKLHTETVTIGRRSWWSHLPDITVEIECAADALPGVKLGLAVKLAFANREVLSGADLRGADLRGADLRGADLRDADLRGADLSDAVLSDAVLRGADLSGAVLRGAVLSGADLRGADLSGAVLSGADLRGAVLRGAVLSGADLRGADLRGADLRGADLRDADLRGADLSGAVLSGAVLRGAVLRGAVLRGAVLSGAPKIENIHQAVYAAAAEPGALDMSQWHCGTTHCRAGWVVTLAGEEGKALESKIGTPAAATLIYLASDPDIQRIPSFYCGDAEALADMKAMAEAEAGKAA